MISLLKIDIGRRSTAPKDTVRVKLHNQNLKCNTTYRILKTSGLKKVLSSSTVQVYKEEKLSHFVMKAKFLDDNKQKTSLIE